MDGRGYRDLAERVNDDFRTLLASSQKRGPKEIPQSIAECHRFSQGVADECSRHTTALDQSVPLPRRYNSASISPGGREPLGYAALRN